MMKWNLYLHIIIGLCMNTWFEAWTIIACLNPSVRQFNNEKNWRSEKHHNTYIQCTRSRRKEGSERARKQASKQCRRREFDLDISEWQFLIEFPTNYQIFMTKSLNFVSSCCCCYFQAIISLSSQTMICSWSCFFSISLFVLLTATETLFLSLWFGVFSFSSSAK